MTDRPLVTFFVIAYNQERFIREAVEGAFAQTYQPLEIVISDDCSTDRTFEIIDKMATEYGGPHTVILNRNSANLGLTAHVDHIVSLANGDLIIGGAGDDISEPDRVAVYVEVWLDTGRPSGSIYSALRRIDENSNDIGVIYSGRTIINDPSPLNICTNNLNITGATHAWTRDIFEFFGPLHPGPLVEDTPILFRSSLIGSVTYIDRPLVRHRIGGISSFSRYLSGQNYLFGERLTYTRWFASIYRSYLRDMELIDFPDREACREICREQLARFDFEIELAEGGYFQRIVKIPKALRLSLESRNTTPLIQAIKYLFDKPYMAYLDTKHGLLKWRKLT